MYLSIHFMQFIYQSFGQIYKAVVILTMNAHIRRKCQLYTCLADI